MVATVRNLTSSSATSEYFRQDGGYYLRDGEDAADLRAKRAEHRNASAWHGQGAAALELQPGNPVGARAFERLLQGHVIGTRLRLGRRRDGQHQHRPGFDITFSAPKSVSLAALLPTKEHPHGDRSVIRAHNAAVRETLDWIEGTLLETRGWDPVTRRRPRVKAPCMVAALFRHIASRNLDPQLHTHAVIANMTRDGDGRWKSVEPTLLHRNARLIGAYYKDGRAIAGLRNEPDISASATSRGRRDCDVQGCRPSLFDSPDHGAVHRARFVRQHCAMQRTSEPPAPRTPRRCRRLSQENPTCPTQSHLIPLIPLKSHSSSGIPLNPY